MKPHRIRRGKPRSKTVPSTRPVPLNAASIPVLRKASSGPALPKNGKSYWQTEEPAEKVLQQLGEVISEFSQEYPQHTRSIPVPLPGEHPLIAFVRSMAKSMARKQKQLEKLHKEALETVKAEEQFLANMSHEVRTPMNAIFGMVNLLLEMDLTPTQRDYIETIHGGSELLLNVMNDVLDLSKITAQKLVLKPRAFRIRKILDDILWTYLPVASKKAVELEGSIDDSIPEYLLGDDLRLKQILSNLISNAVKFTPDGIVSIRVDQDEGSGSNESKLRFTIKDSGIGISEKDGKSLFDPFTQADTLHTEGGTGLGLAICKNLLNLMEGEIWFESEPGCGTSFIFTVTLREASESEKAERTAIVAEIPRPSASNQTEPIRGIPRRVLVAEDNVVNQKVARLSLEKLGCEVSIANNGEEAVDMAAAEGVRYDMICMDVSMPIMNGIEATKRIRQLDGPNSETRILAVTGLAFDDDRNECLRSGMDDFLTKPFSINDLRKQLLAINNGESDQVALSS